MSAKAWIINLVLAAVVVFLGINAYDAWSKAEKRLPVAGEGKGSVPVPQKTVAKADVSPESEYDSVMSLNLFSISRSPGGQEKETPEPKPKPGPDEKLVKLLQETVKRISIYGIIIANGEKKALIKSPAMPLLAQQDNRRQSPFHPPAMPVLGQPGKPQQPPRSGEEIIWVKVGDAVNRFTVNEIKATGVVLGAEGLVFDVALYDKDQPKQRVPEKTAVGPIVIDTGKEAPAGSAPDQAEAPKEKSPEKEIPIEAGQKPPAPAAAQKAEPEKR